MLAKKTILHSIQWIIALNWKRLQFWTSRPVCKNIFLVYVDPCLLIPRASTEDSFQMASDSHTAEVLYGKDTAAIWQLCRCLGGVRIWHPPADAAVINVCRSIADPAALCSDALPRGHGFMLKDRSSRQHTVGWIQRPQIKQLMCWRPSNSRNCVRHGISFQQEESWLKGTDFSVERRHENETLQNSTSMHVLLSKMTVIQRVNILKC